MTDADNSDCLVSIVVPAYNEADVLPEFHRRVSAVLEGLEDEFELVFVDDGSTDATRGVLDRLCAEDDRVGVVLLSRNFGKEAAITAGLDHARGQAVVLIDADLQDPPELIPTFIERWREGYDVVYGQRNDRSSDSWFKRTTAHCFYLVMQHTGHVRIPQQAGDFRLLSRRAVDAVRSLREHHRFMKGLYAWVGFPQIAVPYAREPRAAGTTKWSVFQLWTLAIEGITSFTVAPLKLASYLGLATATGSFFYGAWIIVRTLFMGSDVPGYASIMVVVLFLGGIQLMALGVIGEYLGRTFNESKARPLYLVDQFKPASTRARRDPGPGGSVRAADEASSSMQSEVALPLSQRSATHGG